MLAEMTTGTIALISSGGVVVAAGLGALGVYWNTRGKPKADKAPPPCAHHADMKRQLERGEDKFVRIDKKLDRQTAVQGEMKGALGRIEGYLEAMK